MWNGAGLLSKEQRTWWAASLLCELFSSWGGQGLLSSFRAQASHCGGFSWCRAWALGRGFTSCSSWALELWCVGLAALRPVPSPQIRGGTCVSRIARWTRYHRATGEALNFLFATRLWRSLGINNKPLLSLLYMEFMEFPWARGKTCRRRRLGLEWGED